MCLSEVFVDIFMIGFQWCSEAPTLRFRKLAFQMDRVKYNQEEVLRELVQLDTNKGYRTDALHTTLRLVVHLIFASL